MLHGCKHEPMLMLLVIHAFQAKWPAFPSKALQVPVWVLGAGPRREKSADKMQKAKHR